MNNKECTKEQFLNDILPIDVFIEHAGIKTLDDLEWYLKSEIGGKYDIIKKYREKQDKSKEDELFLEFVEGAFSGYRSALVNLRKVRRLNNEQ